MGPSRATGRSQRCIISALAPSFQTCCICTARCGVCCIAIRRLPSLTMNIVIDTAGINALFSIREAYKLDILQPAMRYPLGKADHSINRQRPWVYLRYTDFVEMTCPCSAARFWRHSWASMSPRSAAGGWSSGFWSTSGGRGRACAARWRLWTASPA